jgi:hypothetical protein
MNPTIQRKEFVSGLIDILNLAIDKSLLDDADVVTPTAAKTFAA